MNWNMLSYYGHGLYIPKDHYSFQHHSNAREVISVGHGEMNSVMLPADLITALERSDRDAIMGSPSQQYDIALEHIS